MTSDQRLLLINSFIKSPFSYCPLLWMFCNLQQINETNIILAECLNLTRDKDEDEFNILLQLSVGKTTN